jgi:biotin synthesis protein BioG
MKSEWLHQRKSKKLIVFCNGWGMDKHPFAPLGSKEWDVLMFYDYSNLNHEQDLYKLFNEYGDIVLIAWSMGVWAGQQLFKSFRDKLITALAINGTLCPIDEQYGIPKDIIRSTLDNFGEKQRLKFYNRMCRDRVLSRQFLENQPQRNIENQKEELAALLKSAKCYPDEISIYKKVFVSRNDLIMPTKNQLYYWKKGNVYQTEGSHFLFYAYNCWDDIVAGIAS